MKIYWTQKLTQRFMISNLKHLAPSIQNSLLYIHTTFILFLTNLQLISLNVHFSNHPIFIHMLHSLPNTYHPWPYKATPLFKFKNGGMTFVLPSKNLCQQTRAGHHTIKSNQKIRTSPNFSSHHTLILNTSQQKKTMKHSQENSDFILLKIPPYHNHNHQNHISNLLITCTVAMDSKFLSMLYSP